MTPVSNVNGPYRVLAGALMLVIGMLVECANLASAQNRHHDPYCPGTDAPEHRLEAAVGRSPHHATADIGDAVVATYEAYIICANSYKQHGNVEKYIYATAQGSGLYAFAAKDYHALGMRNRTAAVLRRGQSVLHDALTTTSEYVTTSSEYPRYRDQIRGNLDEINRMLGEMRLPVTREVSVAAGGVLVVE